MFFFTSNNVLNLDFVVFFLCGNAAGTWGGEKLNQNIPDYSRCRQALVRSNARIVLIQFALGWPLFLLLIEVISTFVRNIFHYFPKQWGLF